MYISLFNKSLAALALLEDNFLDCVYPICRFVIEVYLKLLVLKNRPEALKEHSAFNGYDLHKSLTKMGWSKESLANSAIGSERNAKQRAPTSISDGEK